ARVAEVHMLEINVAVLHFLNRVVRILHLRNLCKHLCDTVRGRLGDHDHCKYKCNHHKGHQDLQRVHDDAGQLTGLHAALDDALAAHQHHDDDHRINGELHDRGVPCHDLLRLRKEVEHAC